MHCRARIARLTAGVLILSGVLTGACGPVSAGSARFAASVVRVTGKAWQSPTGKRTQSQLAGGALIETGAVVYTGARSNLTLAFADGSRVELRENTRVVVGPKGLENRPDYDSTLCWLSRAQIKVVIGSIWLQIRKHLDGMWGFEVETPAASVAVRGTEFGVTVAEDQSIDVIVAAGLVEVYNSFGRELLSPGQSGHVNRGGKPAKSHENQGKGREKGNGSHGKWPGGKPGGNSGGKKPAIQKPG